MKIIGRLLNEIDCYDAIAAFSRNIIRDVGAFFFHVCSIRQRVASSLAKVFGGFNLQLVGNGDGFSAAATLICPGDGVGSRFGWGCRGEWAVAITQCFDRGPRQLKGAGGEQLNGLIARSGINRINGQNRVGDNGDCNLNGIEAFFI